MISDIFLISFNRLSSLSSMIDRLENENIDITIIDNNSTYAPLVEYLNNSPHRVIFLEENLGHLSPWKSGIIENAKSSHYIVSDNDLDISGLPNDFLTYLYELSLEFTNYFKIGLSLISEDIPNYFPMSISTKKWERQLCRTHRDRRLVDAGVDTTFAVYRSGESWKNDTFSQDFSHGVRTSYPYVCRHLPWYWNPSTLTVEDVFYIESCSSEISQGWTNAVKKYLSDTTRYQALKKESKKMSIL